MARNTLDSLARIYQVVHELGTGCKRDVLQPIRVRLHV